MSIRGRKSDLVKLLKAEERTAPADIEFLGVQFGSNQITPGMIFVALKGEKNHGESFLNDAFSRGAALAVVESRSILDGPYGDKCIVVSDSLVAFQSMARWWRAQLKAKFLAITGSVGKTTTKELAGAALKVVGQGTFSKKSFNNHVGVPFTVCQVAPDDLWAVCEIGTNHPGEIAPLAGIVRPHVAVVTTIGPAHIEFFGNVENIAKEKLSIAGGLFSEGTLVVNADSEELMSALESSSTKYNLRTFGFSNKADLKISSPVYKGIKGVSFRGTFKEENSEEAADVELSLFGKSSVINGAAALLAAKLLFPSKSLQSFSEGLKMAAPPEMRLNIVRLPDGRRILNDAYNANPMSMEAALETVQLLADSNDTICCVLGDMRELGNHSEEYHAELAAKLPGVTKLIEVISVGEYSKCYGDALRGTSIKFSSFNTAEEAIPAALNAGASFFLVKGSRGIELEKVIAALNEGISVPPQ